MKKYGFPNKILNMVKRQGFDVISDGFWTPPFSVVWSIWDKKEKESKTEMIFIK